MSPADPPRPPTPAARPPGMARTMITTWTRVDWLHTAALLGFVLLMHVVGFGVLFAVVAPLNLAGLIGVIRVFRAMRRGVIDEAELEQHLASRGLLTRVLGRLTRAITRPGQMFAIGMLFGLGFDTATEVAILILAGTGA